MSDGITEEFLREVINKNNRFPGFEYRIGQHAMDNMKGKIEKFVEDLVEESVFRAAVFNKKGNGPITIREHDVVMGTVEVYSKHSKQLEEFRKIPLHERRGCDV